MRVTLSTLGTYTPVEFIGGVFPRRQISVISSEPGCGKTWVMLKFCADVSSISNWGKLFGQSWIEKDRKCLMFIGDSGKEMITGRCIQLKVNETAQDKNFVMYFVEDMQREKYPYLLNTDDGRKTIQRLIHQEQPDVVFFDTLISFMTSDENSAKEVAEIFTEVRGMAEEENCAIVLNHHFRKSGKGEKTRKTATLNEVIGSSAISRLSAVMLGMSKNVNETENKTINVFSIKSWYKEIESFQFEIKNVGNSVEISPKYILGNTKRAYSILTKFSKQVNSGMIISVETLALATKINADMLKIVLSTHPAYTPLTDDKECDRFIVHQEEGKV